MKTTDKNLMPLTYMARRLHIKKAWLKEQADKGVIPCLKAGDQYLFVPEKVRSILIEMAEGATDGR